MKEELKNLLDRNSDRVLLRISSEELNQINEAIKAILDEAFSMDKDNLMRFISSNRFGDSKNTLFHLTAKFGFQDQLLRILNIASYDQNFVDIRNEDDFTPLHFAAFNGHLEIVKELIKVGAQKDAQASEKKRKWTPVHYAAQYGHIDVVKSLIESGVDKEIKTIFGLTPLHVACEFGKLEVVQYLLSLKVNKNIKTVDANHRMTALHYAVIGNFREIVIELLNANCDKDQKTILGFTALDFAVQKDLLDIVDILLEYGANGYDSPLKTAIRHGNKPIVQKIKAYQKARAKLFSESYLKRNGKKIATTMSLYDKDNLGDCKILIQSAAFNPYALLSMKQRPKIGFFKFDMFERSIPEIATALSILELCAAIHKINKLGVVTPL